MLTRSGVAKRLRKSLATVRRMEGNELHPEVDSDGVHWFDEDEVDLLAKGGNSRASAIPARRRDASDAGDGSRRGSEAIAAASAVERRQREIDLRSAQERAAALAGEVDAAKERIEELTEEHRKMRSIIRTLGTLVMDIADPRALAHMEPTLLSVIHACASYED